MAGINLIFCTCWTNVLWLQNYLIPCPFKKLTGIDCPGCGFQRSVLALFSGQLHQSIVLYPATIPIVAAVIFSTFNGRLNLTRYNAIKKGLFILSAIVVLVSYTIKITRNFF